MKVQDFWDDISRANFLTLRDFYEKEIGEDICDQIREIVDQQARYVKTLVDKKRVKDIATEFSRLVDLSKLFGYCVGT